VQDPNHHDEQDHDEKQMDKTSDGGERHYERAQKPKNQKNNDDRFKHDEAPSIPYRIGNDDAFPWRFSETGKPVLSSRPPPLTGKGERGCEEHGTSLAEAFNELIGIFLRLLLGDPIMLLDRSSELIAFASDGSQIVIGEFPPLFLDFARELFPIAGDLIPIHNEPPGFDWGEIFQAKKPRPKT
jgi:hypothetical protein